MEGARTSQPQLLKARPRGASGPPPGPNGVGAHRGDQGMRSELALEYGFAGSQVLGASSLPEAA